MIEEVPLTIINEISSVIDILAAFGVFHSDLEELFHGGVISMIIIFVGVKHIFGDAHGIQFIQNKICQTYCYLSIFII